MFNNFNLPLTWFIQCIIEVFRVTLSHQFLLTRAIIGTVPCLYALLPAVTFVLLLPLLFITCRYRLTVFLAKLLFLSDHNVF